MFPDPASALTSPDGLLAFGGDLEPRTLLSAYNRGIFPWYDDNQPVLWWSPSVRAVLIPGREHISRSMKKCFRQHRFRFSTDSAFATVIASCAAPRQDSEGTWITDDMVAAYRRLNAMGYCHSVECWRDGRLVGGLYGVQLGQLFCGESMFSLEPNASKAAFIVLSQTLADAGLALIDCQIMNPHLGSLGVKTMTRSEFLARIPLYTGHNIDWPDSNDFQATSDKLGQDTSRN